MVTKIVRIFSGEDEMSIFINVNGKIVLNINPDNQYDSVVFQLDKHEAKELAKELNRLSKYVQ